MPIAFPVNPGVRLFSRTARGRYMAVRGGNRCMADAEAKLKRNLFPRGIRCAARQGRRAWLLVGGLGVLLLLLEGIARVSVPKPAPPSFPLFADEPELPAARLQEAYFTELAAAMRLPWEPYVYWRLPEYSGTHIRIGSDGFRRTWNGDAPPGPTSATRWEIWMLGGSALWGIGARDDQTIPSLVSRWLAERGIPAIVRNLAVVGYVSTQETWTLIEELGKGGRPDVVVFYNGSNDVLSSYFNRRAGVTLLEPKLEDHWLKTVVRRSGIARATRHALFRAGSNLLRAELLSSDQFLDLTRETARVYRNNVDLARRLGASHGFGVLVAPQPLSFHKPSRHPDEELGLKRDDFVHIGGYDVDAPGTELGGFYLAVYEALAEGLATEPGYCDLRSVFRDESGPRFIDYCHTTELANSRIAAVLGEALARLRAEGR